MTAIIVPFPMASRRSMILRQARYAAGLNPDAAERHLQQQLKVQGQAMRRKGIDEPLIAHEIHRLETSIRTMLLRAAAGGAQWIVPRNVGEQGRTTNRIVGKRFKAALGLPQGVGWSVPMPRDLLNSHAWLAMSGQCRKLVDAVMAERADLVAWERGRIPHGDDAVPPT